MHLSIKTKLCSRIHYVITTYDTINNKKMQIEPGGLVHFAASKQCRGDNTLQF